MFPSMSSVQVFALLIGFACISSCSGADMLTKPVDVPVGGKSQTCVSLGASRSLTLC